MSTAVLIPWRSTGCPHRYRALTFVISKLAVHGWPVVIGHHDEGPWCKALAIADALDQTHADVLVIHDADVVTEGLLAAVRTATAGAAWCVPHRGVHRLTEASTGRYMAGEAWEDLELEERSYLGFEGGGVTVIRRSVYMDCPLDARFTGFGGEDDSWGFALRTLHGQPCRPTSYVPLAHLWHPPQMRATRAIGSMANRDLRKRYARAQGNRLAMRELVDEHRLALMRQ